MTKKLFRLTELVIAALAGAVTAFYRVSLARGGSALTFGGITHPSGLLYILICLCIAGFAAAAIFLWSRQALQRGPAGRAYTVVLSLSALTLFAAFALMLGEGFEGLFQKVQLVFLLVCGGAMILKIVLGEKHRLTGLLSLFPIYYLCLFLLLFYRENAKNPSVQSFALEIICVMVVLVALYVLASTKFEKPKQRQHIFFTLSAIYLLVMECVSALIYPDLVLTVPGMSPGIVCMLAGFGLYITASFFLSPVRISYEEEESAPSSAANAVLESEPEEELIDVDREELLRTILRDAEEITGNDPPSPPME